MTQHIIKPEYDEESRPFWEGLQNKTLFIQQCTSCQKHIFYPRSLCPHCFSEKIQWIESKGKGKIYSYTVVHQAFGPYKKEVPYVVGIVELDEGVRMMTRFIGDRNQIRIGKKVTVSYEQIEDDFILPYFQLS